MNSRDFVETWYAKRKLYSEKKEICFFSFHNYLAVIKVKVKVRARKLYRHGGQHSQNVGRLGLEMPRKEI